MTAIHRYNLGEKVHIMRTFLNRHLPNSEYEVLRQLPDSDGELQYRVRSTGETHERVVKESAITAVPA